MNEGQRRLKIALILWGVALVLALLLMSRIFFQNISLLFDPEKAALSQTPAVDRSMSGGGARPVKGGPADPEQAVGALTIAPQQAAPGDVVELSGAGFIFEEPVVVQFRSNGVDLLTYGTDILDPEGRYAQRIELHATLATESEVIIEVIGQESGTRLLGTLRIVAPTQSSTNVPLAPTSAVATAAATTAPSTGDPVVDMATAMAAAAATAPASTARAGSPAAPISPLPTPLPSPTMTPLPNDPNFPDWQVSYYSANMNATGPPALVSNNPVISFDWGKDRPVRETNRVGSNFFAVRWTKSNIVIPGPQGRDYRFVLAADDWAQMVLRPNMQDGVASGNTDMILKHVGQGAEAPSVARLFLDPGEYSIDVLFREYWGDAFIYFYWEPAVNHARWYGEFYPNAELRGPPVMTMEVHGHTFEQPWTESSLAVGTLPEDQFSSRWTQMFEITKDQVYQYCIFADDGIRLWIDRRGRVIDEWEPHEPRLRCETITLEAGTHNFLLEYFDAAGVSALKFWIAEASRTAWYGVYYPNVYLSGMPAALRSDEKLKFNWGTGAPIDGVSADQFSVRWHRELTLPDGDVTLFLKSDDGSRLWIDDELFMDMWSRGSARTISKVFPAAKTRKVMVKVEYFEQSELAEVEFWYATATPLPTPTATPTRTPVPTVTPGP